MKSASDHPASPFDSIVEDLQRLRVRAGDVSYAEIAMRIARRRETQGASAAAARVARTTVFDAFRSGRRRINAELVTEIVIALGESEHSAEQWRGRCLDARLSSGQAGEMPPPKAAQAKGAFGLNAWVPVSPGIAPDQPQLRSLQFALIIALLVGCVGLNIFGNTVADKFSLPLFLDMIGTATAAFAFGPWYGASVGLATNLFATVSGSPTSLAFTLVNVTGALVWGYGYHRFGLGRTPLRFLLLNVYAGVACTIVAVPITIVVLGGSVTHASNETTAFLASLGQGIWVAVFSSNLLSSLGDKLISGYLAYMISRVLAPLQLRDRKPDGRDPYRVTAIRARRTSSGAWWKPGGRAFP